MTNHAQTVLCTSMDFITTIHKTNLQVTNYSLYKFVCIHKSHDETMPKSVLALRKTRAGRRKNKHRALMIPSKEEEKPNVHVCYVHGYTRMTRWSPATAGVRAAAGAWRCS